MDKELVIEKLQANRPLLETFSVQSIGLFGSVVRGDAGPDSDVDILVEFRPDARIGFFTLSRLQRCLIEIIGRPVDLVTPDALHKRMKIRILEEVVYAL
jgi:uncharacterized protein